MTILKGGPLLFACLVGIFAFIGMHEFYGMALPGRGIESWLAAVLSAVIIFIPFLGKEHLATGAMALLFLAFALLFLFRIKDIADAAREIALAMMAFLYIPFLLMHLVMLRQTIFGVQWLFVIMLIVMIN